MLNIFQTNMTSGEKLDAIIDWIYWAKLKLLRRKWWFENPKAKSYWTPGPTRLIKLYEVSAGVLIVHWGRLAKRLPAPFPKATVTLPAGMSSNPTQQELRHWIRATDPHLANK